MPHFEVPCKTGEDIDARKQLQGHDLLLFEIDYQEGFSQKIIILGTVDRFKPQAAINTAQIICRLLE